MAIDQLNSVLQRVRRVALGREQDRATDGSLLAAFIARRDEAAFEGLVRRHGGMVLGVCRRVVGNLEDAQDAFQATFLVLARKAGSVTPAEMVGNWLYGVAYRTALEARTKSARRRAREKQVIDLPHPRVEYEPGEAELLRLLDRELNRLPEKYRTPIVLCDLEGRSRAEAAKQLQVPEGTLSSRLATARKLLAARMSRPGVALSVAGLVAFLFEQSARATLPAALVAAGSASAAGLVSAHVVALTDGVLKAMLLTKVKSLASWMVACGLLVVGLAVVWQNNDAPAVGAAPAPLEKPAPQVKTPTSVPAQNQEEPNVQEQPAKKEEPRKDAALVYTEVHITMGKVIIRQTGKNAVEINADPLFVAMAKTSVENGVLILKAPNPSIEFIVDVKELTGLKVDGVSQVEVKDLKTARLEVTLDSVARVTVSGTAQEQVILVKGGAASFNGEACRGKEARVTVSGAGKAIVNVTDKLTVSIPSAGQVEYLGSPKIEQNVSIAGRLRARTDGPIDKAAPPKQELGKKKPEKKEPEKIEPGSVKITAKVDGYTQGTEFNTQKYPFKYTNTARVSPDQLKALAKPGDVPEAAAKALLSAALWPGKDDKLDKVKLKSDGKNITGTAEVVHKYGKQGTHILQFKVEGTFDTGKLTLHAVEPAVVGTWDWGGGMIKLVGKVDIQFIVGE